MKKFFGYTRVSTAKQGERGVSLQEQREAIARYAQRYGLEIVQWFEERQTAAKRGRAVFNHLLKLLRHEKASGVIIHKIDRSARNLKDWADLGELIDGGIEVHFANESLDLHSRGGRLSADIQAVVAADYIRNLREETRKGFYGRLKQGVYPLPAPLGYLDMGKGKPKELDPIKAPLVRKAFELYGTGRFNLKGLVEEVYRLGLRNKRGSHVTLSGLSAMFNNPFYIGLIRLRRTGETFPGAQEPLITKQLFDRVQRILKGKVPTRALIHDFLFRRLLRCHHCGYSLIGELQKGHVYYRCHAKNCPTKGIREDAMNEVVQRVLPRLNFTGEERLYLEHRVAQMREHWVTEKEEAVKALTIRLGQLNERVARLTDAYIDGAVEKQLFEERKTALLLERKDTEDKLAAFRDGRSSTPDRLAEFLELAGSLCSSYESAFPEEKRDLLRTVTSNREVDGKNIVLTMAEPFAFIAERAENAHGAPQRDTPRTLDPLIEKLDIWLKQNPAARFEVGSSSHDSVEKPPNKRWRLAA